MTRPMRSIDEIKATAAKATPGPWSADPTGTVCADADLVTRADGTEILPEDGPMEVAECYRSVLPNERADNAEFIARSRTDVDDLLGLVDELLTELDGRDTEASERWIKKQLDETAIRSIDFRNGAHMDIQPARELCAHFVAAARTMLGNAPNYTETPVEFGTINVDVKVAESPDLYTLVVQRHGPGVLTPHQARQRAEAERDAALAEVERLTSELAAARARIETVEHVAKGIKEHVKYIAEELDERTAELAGARRAAALEIAALIDAKAEQIGEESFNHSTGFALAAVAAVGAEVARQYAAASLTEAMGTRTWNSDRADALVDEHPSSYKDINQVMRDQADLVEVQHTLRQVFNYKG